MKKLLITFTNCIIICLLLSSCSSNVSIVKRHYRGGYYVDRTKKATSATPVTSEVAKTSPTKRVYISSISSQKNLNIIKGIPNENTVLPPNTIIALQENIQHKNSNSFTEKLIKQPGIIETPALQKETTFSEGIAGGDGGGGGRAALSLLWIVIIIILILWLIGLLAGGLGLGGLINVLLVIALVLLILWLLRII